MKQHKTEIAFEFESDKDGEVGFVLIRDGTWALRSPLVTIAPFLMALNRAYSSCQLDGAGAVVSIPGERGCLTMEHSCTRLVISCGRQSVTVDQKQFEAEMARVRGHLMLPLDERESEDERPRLQPERPPTQFNGE